MSRTRLGGLAAAVACFALLFSGLAYGAPGQPVDPGIPGHPEESLVRVADAGAGNEVFYLILKPAERLPVEFPGIPPYVRPVLPSAARPSAGPANALAAVGSGTVSPAAGLASGAFFSSTGGAGTSVAPTDPEAALGELAEVSRSLGLR